MNIYDAGWVFRRNVCQYTHAESDCDILGWHYQCKDKPWGCGFTVALIWHKSSPCHPQPDQLPALASVWARTRKSRERWYHHSQWQTSPCVASLVAATAAGRLTPPLPPAELPAVLRRCCSGVSARCWGAGELQWLWGRTNATATAEELPGEPVWPSAPKHCPAPKTCWCCPQKTESRDESQAVGKRGAAGEGCPVPASGAPRAPFCEEPDTSGVTSAERAGAPCTRSRDRSAHCAASNQLWNAAWRGGGARACSPLSVKAVPCFGTVSTGKKTPARGSSPALIRC